MAVGVPGLFPQPVNSVEVLIGADVWEGLVQEIHQVPCSIHLLGGSGGGGGSGAAGTWHRDNSLSTNDRSIGLTSLCFM